MSSPEPRRTQPATMIVVQPANLTEKEWTVLDRAEAGIRAGGNSRNRPGSRGPKKPAFR